MLQRTRNVMSDVVVATLREARSLEKPPDVNPI